jgi:hypothetical protein
VAGDGGPAGRGGRLPKRASGVPAVLSRGPAGILPSPGASRAPPDPPRVQVPGHKSQHTLAHTTAALGRKEVWPVRLSARLPKAARSCSQARCFLWVLPLLLSEDRAHRGPRDSAPHRRVQGRGVGSRKVGELPCPEAPGWRQGFG